MVVGLGLQLDLSLSLSLGAVDDLRLELGDLLGAEFFDLHVRRGTLCQAGLCRSDVPFATCFCTFRGIWASSATPMRKLYDHGRFAFVFIISTMDEIVPTGEFEADEIWYRERKGGSLCFALILIITRDKACGVGPYHCWLVGAADRSVAKIPKPVYRPERRTLWDSRLTNMRCQQCAISADMRSQRLAIRQEEGFSGPMRHRWRHNRNCTSKFCRYSHDGYDGSRGELHFSLFFLQETKHAVWVDISRNL